MPAATAPVASRLALELEDGNLTTLRSFSGLGARADIAQHASGPALNTKKHVAAVRFTPGRMSLGLGMGKGMYAWLKAALEGRPVVRSGTLKRADANNRVQLAQKFSDALITEFTVPRLDAGSRDIGAFDMAITPGQVAWSGATGEIVPPAAATRAKAWVVSNFKVAIGSLPCSRVAVVESFTWSTGVPAEPIGIGREPIVAIARPSVPDLKLSIGAADLDAWARAAHQWFIGGRRQDADEMTGRIALLDANQADELASIELGNVGFKAFSYPDAVATDQVARFSVELYVEQLRLVIPELER